MSNVRPGPKGEVDMTPLPLIRFPRNRARRVEKFARTFILVPKGHGARKPFLFRKWQREILDGLCTPGVRQALVAIARANGKSTLAAVLAVFDLFTTESAQVIVVASDQRQATIILNTVRRMIEISPELAKRARVLKDHIEVPGMGSAMFALPSDEGALNGWDPSLCLVDELHMVTRPVWEAVTGFSGKRPDSLTLAISTPSDRHDSIMKTLVDLGREGTDESFYFKEFTSDPSHPIDCECCWLSANPALDDFLSRDGLASVMKTMREPSFRRYRLAQWVSPETAWLTPAQWKEREDTKRVLRPQEEIVAFFDGSFSDDSTALVGCTLALPHHLFLIELWEKPDHNEDSEWRVPRVDVNRVIDQTFKTYRVRELACDPYGWRSEIQQWARKYGRQRVIEYPTNVRGRMGPATDRATEAVLEAKVTHDGSPDLARHVCNATVTHSKYGDLLVKERSKSPHKIDAAVAAVGAHDRALFHAHAKKQSRGLKVVASTW